MGCAAWQGGRGGGGGENGGRLDDWATGRLGDCWATWATGQLGDWSSFFSRQARKEEEIAWTAKWVWTLLFLHPPTPSTIHSPPPPPPPAPPLLPPPPPPSPPLLLCSRLPSAAGQIPPRLPCPSPRRSEVGATRTGRCSFFSLHAPISMPPGQNPRCGSHASVWWINGLTLAHKIDKWDRGTIGARSTGLQSLPGCYNQSLAAGLGPADRSPLLAHGACQVGYPDQTSPHPIERMVSEDERLPLTSQRGASPRRDAGRRTERRDM